MSNKNDAHKIAMEWLKHLITLSSSIIVFSGTLVGAVFEELNWSLVILMIAWGLFIAVILLSLETISAITDSRIHSDDEWTSGRSYKMSLASKWCFGLGMIFFVIFAIINFVLIITAA